MKSKEYFRQVWREAIFQSVASEGNSNDTANNLAAKYDTLTDTGKMSAESAANIILSCYSSNGKEVFHNVKTLVDHCANASGEVAEYIHHQLKLKAKDYPSIEKDSLARLRKVIARHSKNLDVLSSVTIDGIGLSESELDSVKTKMPEVFKTQSFSAVASTREKPAKNLALQIWF